MASFFFLSIPGDPIPDLLGNISGIFEWFNGIVSIFFSALKYVLFVLLMVMSVLPFLKFKKNYAIFKLNVNNKSLTEKYMLKQKQFISGIAYMVLTLGFCLIL